MSRPRLESTPRAEPSPAPAVLAVVGGALLAAHATLRLLRLDFHWLGWMNRDLFRAWTGGPPVGAELSHGDGARLPGGAWHLLLGLGERWGGGPDGAWRFFLLLDGLAALLVGLAARRVGGAWAGVLAAALWLAPSPARDALTLFCNPAMMPLFLALSTVALGRALEGGSRTAWFAWAWAGAVAGQGHFLALVTLASCAGALLLLRPRDLLRASPWAGLGLLLAYLRYGVAELLTGAPNTHALLGMDPVSTLTARRGLVWEPADLATSVQHLLPHGPLGWGVGMLAVTGLVAAPGLRRPHRDLLLALGAALLANLLVPTLEAEIGPDLHYTLPVLPALVGLATAGALVLVQVTPQRARGLVLALLLLATLSGPAREAVALAEATPAVDVFSWRGRRLALQALQEHLDGGADLSEVAGRSFFAVRDRGGAGWALTRTDGIDWLLWKDHRAFRGSLPPPCAGVFDVDTSTPPITGEDVAATLGWPAEGFVVLDQIELSPSMRLVRYRPPGDLCPTMMTDRYVDTAKEWIVRPLDGTLQRGEVRELTPAYLDGRLPGLPDLRGFGFHTYVTQLREESRDFYGDVLVAVEVDLFTVDVEVTLHSAQLRGVSHSHGGWLRAGLLSDIDVVFTPSDGGDPVVVALARGAVGPNGIVTPLSAPTTPLRAATWTVTLRATLHDPTRVPPSGTWIDAPGVRREVVLTDALVVEPL